MHKNRESLLSWCRFLSKASAILSLVFAISVIAELALDIVFLDSGFLTAAAASSVVVFMASTLMAKIEEERTLKSLQNAYEQLEERIHDRTTQMQLLLDSTAEGIYGLDVAGNCTFCNSSCISMLGYRNPQDLIGKNVHELIHYKKADGSPYAAEKCPISRASGRGEKIHVEDEVMWRADGTSIAVEYWSYPIVKEERLIGAVVTFIDIAERRESERALQRSEQLYRLLAENTNDVIARLLPDSTYLYLSPACRSLFGYEPEELKGTKGFALIHPDDIGRITAITEDALNASGTTIARYRHRRKDGTYIWVENVGKVVKNDATGEIQDIICSVRDITERKEVEESLRQSEAELHDNFFSQAAINMILSESLENMPLELILQKALNMVLAVPWISFESSGSIHLVEKEPGILIMKAQSNLPDSLLSLCARVPFGQCLCGRAALNRKIEFADAIDERHEIRDAAMTPHGHYSVPLAMAGKTLGVLNIHLKEGHVRLEKEEEFLRAVADTLAVIIVHRQVEEEKEKLHHQLVQAQKMEAIGQLAGGIAHDFNNILTAIISYGCLLQMKLKKDDPLNNYVDHILSSSDRAATLTHSLLAFSRQQLMQPLPVDLNQIILKVEKLLQRLIGEDIELESALYPQQLTIMADPVQIEQVFMNLATNARDAMPRGGRLKIETSVVELEETFINTHGYGEIGEYALISVSDTGIGMDEKTRQRIFEPFYTTKGLGKGTGLGLSMAYGIIKQLNGYITVYSEPGKGTTFQIYLSLIRTKPVGKDTPEEYTPTGGNETILLAEDNGEVRASTKLLLENFGYKVIESADGEDAIAKFNGLRDIISMVMLDVVLPKKNGKDVYTEIEKIRPGVKALFTSGYTADFIQHKDMLSDSFEFIHKPVPPRELLKRIRELLDTNKN